MPARKCHFPARRLNPSDIIDFEQRRRQRELELEKERLSEMISVVDEGPEIGDDEIMGYLQEASEQQERGQEMVALNQADEAMDLFVSALISLDAAKVLAVSQDDYELMDLIGARQASLRDDLCYLCPAFVEP